MSGLAETAAEEEGSGSSPSSPATLNLGGFKIDPGMIKTLMELYKMAQDIGLIGPGGLNLGGLTGGTGGGTPNPFLKP